MRTPSRLFSRPHPAPAWATLAAFSIPGLWLAGCADAQPVVIGRPTANAAPAQPAPATLTRPAATADAAPAPAFGTSALPPLIGGAPEAPAPAVVDEPEEAPAVAQVEPTRPAVRPRAAPLMPDPQHFGPTPPAVGQDAAVGPAAAETDSGVPGVGGAEPVAGSDPITGEADGPAADSPEAPVARFIEMVLRRKMSGYSEVLVRRPDSTQLRMLLRGDVDDDFMDLAVSNVQGATHDETIPRRRTQIVKYTKTDGTVLGFIVDLEEGEWKIENLTVNRISSY